MGKIRGTTVQLISRQKTGADAFGKAIYTEQSDDIDNVLIGEPSSEEIVDTLELTGKQLAYTLAIPKGDTHIWTGCKVSFWGETFRVIGEPTQGIEENTPLSWNKKVRVERNG